MLDNARLKEGNPRGIDYFDELLARIRDIRSSEKVLYRKLRDIFALSTDYTEQAQENLQHFFQAVQNKMHWAAAGATAAEIVYKRAGADKPNIGLQSWAGAKVKRGDVATAKNYLDGGELDTLNRIVVMFLDQAEFRAQRRQAVYMHEWEEWLEALLQGQELPVLDHFGSVSSEPAKAKAFVEYDKFHVARLAREAAEANAELEGGSAAIEELARKAKK